MHVVYNYDMYWIQLYVTDGRSWFFPGTLVSSTNNTERHDITEILLKVTLNTKYRQRKNVKYITDKCELYLYLMITTYYNITHLSLLINAT